MNAALDAWLAAGDAAGGNERDVSLLDSVPGSRRAEVEGLLVEARPAYALRDDNASTTLSWPSGLLRRGLLAAGGSCKRRGRSLWGPRSLSHPSTRCPSRCGESAEPPSPSTSVYERMNTTTAASVSTGSGIGTTTVRGRARVAASAEDALARIEPGDILVVPFTTPAYNSVRRSPLRSSSRRGDRSATPRWSHAS